MKFLIDDNEDIVLKWLPMFEALSVRRFNWYPHEMGFMGETSQEVRNISRDFVIAINQTLGKVLPFPSITLEVDHALSVDQTVYYAKQIEIWNKTFSALQELDYASRIHTLGNGSFKFDNDIEESELCSSFSLLLTAWAKHTKQQQLDDRIPDPDMSSVTNSELKLLVLRDKLEAQQFELGLSQMQHTPGNTDWENFVFSQLYVTSWMALQARYIRDKKLWDNIYSLLSTSELNVLHSWAKPYIQTNLGFLEITYHLPYRDKPLSDLDVL